MEDAHFELTQCSVQFMLFLDIFYSLGMRYYVLGGYIGEFWDYHMLACPKPYNRLQDTFRKCFTDGITNLWGAHGIRYNEKRKEISTLEFCVIQPASHLCRG